MGPCREQSLMGQHGQSAGSAPEHSAEVDASCVHWMGFPDGYVCLSGAITASGKLLLYWKLAIRESQISFLNMILKHFLQLKW